MTLVQILADETSIHMCCDFRLTDLITGAVVQDDAHKLVQPSLWIPTIMGLTGVARLDGIPAGQWMVGVLDELPFEASFTEITARLQDCLTAALRPIGDPRHRKTTIVVAAMVGSQANVALVSNFEQFQRNKIDRAPLAWPTVITTSTRPKRARYLATGAASAVPQADRTRLEQLLRSGADASRIQAALSQVNGIAASTAKSISTGCYTASFDATLHGSSQPFLTEDQAGDFIPPEFESTMQQLRSSISFEPGDQPSLTTPLRARNIAHFRLGSTPEYFREQLKLRPDDPEVLNNYGSYFQNTKRDSRGAIEQYRKAVEGDPTYVPALANLAKSVWLADQDLEQAQNLYKRVLETPNKNLPGWVLLDLGTFYDLGLGLPDKADAYLQAAVTQNPHYHLAKAFYADFLRRNEQNIAYAAELLSEALDKASGAPLVLRIAGEFAYADGDYETAYGYFASSHSLDPHDAVALDRAGHLSLKMDQPQLAVRYYRRLIDRPNADWSSYMNYGLALLMARKLDGALRQLTKAYELAPDEPLTQVNLAGALFALRRDEHALKCMRRTMERSLPPAIELELLAMLQVAEPSGEQQEALELLLHAGARTGGEVIRAMSQDRSKEQRARGIALAAQVEGAAELGSVP